MKYKLLIAPGNLIKHAELQRDYLKNTYPELEVTIIDSNSEYLKLYNRKPNRFPCIILLKNDGYKSSINAKLDNQNLHNWLSSNSVK